MQDKRFSHMYQVVLHVYVNSHTMDLQSPFPDNTRENFPHLHIQIVYCQCWKASLLIVPTEEDTTLKQPRSTNKILHTPCTSRLWQTYVSQLRQGQKHLLLFGVLTILVGIFESTVIIIIMMMREWKVCCTGRTLTSLAPQIIRLGRYCIPQDCSELMPLNYHSGRSYY